MSVTLAISVDGLTIRAALVAGLATVALLLTGWRQHARAEARSPRGPLRRDTEGFQVVHHDTPLHHRLGILRRVFAAVASGGIGVLTGVLVAIITSFAVAIAVIRMTDLLRR